jgi:hypothetical protein
VPRPRGWPRRPAPRRRVAPSGAAAAWRRRHRCASARAYRPKGAVAWMHRSEPGTAPGRIWRGARRSRPIPLTWTDGVDRRWRMPSRSTRLLSLRVRNHRTSGPSVPVLGQDPVLVPGEPDGPGTDHRSGHQTHPHRTTPDAWRTAPRTGRLRPSYRPRSAVKVGVPRLTEDPSQACLGCGPRAR